MNSLNTRQKSRNDLLKEQPSEQQTAKPIYLYDIKTISKQLIESTSIEFDALNSDILIGNFVKLLNSIREEVSNKFENSKYLNKIEEIFDNNLENVLNYFIECSDKANKIKTNITNNLSNGLEIINKTATDLMNQLLKNNEKSFNNMNEINFNFIFDEEFVNLINSLSTNIKDFMKNCNSNIKNANINSQSISENLSSTKTCLLEMLTNFNLSAQFSKNINFNKVINNSSNSANNSNSIVNLDKNLKEKLNPLIERLEQLSEFRNKIGKNLHNIENQCSKFYEQAKLTFKNLKNLHTEKLCELQKYNCMLNSESINLKNDFHENEPVTEHQKFDNKSKGTKSKNALEAGLEVNNKIEQNSDEKFLGDFIETNNNNEAQIDKDKYNYNANNLNKIKESISNDPNNFSFNNITLMNNNLNSNNKDSHFQHIKNNNSKNYNKLNNTNVREINPSTNKPETSSSFYQNNNSHTCKNNNSILNSNQNPNQALKNKNKENIDKAPIFSLINKPIMNITQNVRSNSNPRTKINKNGRLSNLDNLNILNNQSNLNLFNITSHTPVNYKTNLPNTSKNANKIIFNDSSSEHANNLSKINLNRQNKNINSHSLSLNYSNLISKQLENNNCNTKNYITGVTLKSDQNTLFFEKQINELTLKNSDLNDELNKLHESYNILESENIKLKQMNDKISKFSLVKRPSSNIRNENLTNISSNNTTKNNIKENINLKLNELNNLNKNLQSNSKNLIGNINSNISKSVENNKKNNKTSNKYSSENDNELNNVIINNQKLAESNLIINSNINSNSSKTNKLDVFSLINLSEKIINFIRILNNYLEELNKKSSTGHINEIKSIFEKNKQELIKMANDFLLKSKTWIKENYNATNSNEFIKSQTPSSNLNMKISRLTNNTNTTSEKIISNNLNLNQTNKNLGKNHPQNLINKEIISRNSKNSLKINNNNLNNFIKKQVEIVKESPNNIKSNTKSNLKTNKTIINQNQNVNTLKRSNMNLSNLNNASNLVNTTFNNSYLNTTNNNIQNNQNNQNNLNNNNVYSVYLTNLNKLNKNTNTCTNISAKSNYSSFNVNNKKLSLNKSLGKLNKNNLRSNNPIINNFNVENNQYLQNFEKNNHNEMYSFNIEDDNDHNNKIKNSVFIENESNLNNINDNFTDDEIEFFKGKKYNKKITHNFNDSDVDSENLILSTNKPVIKSNSESKNYSENISRNNSDNPISIIKSFTNKKEKIKEDNLIDLDSYKNSNFNNIAVISNSNLNLNDFDDIKFFGQSEKRNKKEIHNSNVEAYKPNLNIIKNNYINTNNNNLFDNHFSTENNNLTNFELNENEKIDQNILNYNKNNSIKKLNISNITNSFNLNNNREESCLKLNSISKKENNDLALSKNFNNNQADNIDNMQIKLLDSKKFLNEYFKINNKTFNKGNCFETENTENDVVKKSEKSVEKADKISKKLSTEAKTNENLPSFDNLEFITAMRLNINLQETNEKLNKELEQLKKINLQFNNEIEQNKKKLFELNEINESLKKNILENESIYDKDKINDKGSNFIVENNSYIYYKIIKFDYEILSKELIENNNKFPENKNKEKLCKISKEADKSNSNDNLMLEELKKELNKLNNLIKEKEKKIKNYQNDIDKLNQASDQKEKLINTLNKKIRNLESRLITEIDDNNENNSNNNCMTIGKSPLSTHNSVASDCVDVNILIKKIDEFEKQMNLQTNTINELRIKLKVNKNERESLLHEIEKLKKELNDCKIMKQKVDADNKLIETCQNQFSSNFEKTISQENIVNINTLETENKNLLMKLQNTNELNTLITKLEDENSNLVEKLSLKESELEILENSIRKIKEENLLIKKDNENLNEQLKQTRKNQEDKAKLYEENVDHIQKKLKLSSLDNENLINESYNLKREFDIFVDENNEKIKENQIILSEYKNKESECLLQITALKEKEKSFNLRINELIKEKEYLNSQIKQFKIKENLIDRESTEETFNNSLIDEIEKIYDIFYEINPKDYKINKLEKLSLNKKILELCLIKLCDEGNNKNLLVNEITNKIINALKENIAKSIKEIFIEIEEFKNYYLKNFNEENSSNMLNMIPEENIRGSQDINLSPKSIDIHIPIKISKDEILEEKENEIFELEEKYELLEINYNDLNDKQTKKIQELNKVIENLNNNIEHRKTNDVKENDNLLDINYDEDLDDLKLNNILINYEESQNKDNINNNRNQSKDVVYEIKSYPNEVKEYPKIQEEDFKLKYLELSEEYKKLKSTFDECTQTIYDAIKIYSPNILDDDNVSFQISPSGKLHKEPNNLTYNMITDSKGSQISAGSNLSVYSDKEFISKAVEIFKKYNQEINEKNKKLESDLQEAESKIQLYKITAEEYKKALNLSLQKSLNSAAALSSHDKKFLDCNLNNDLNLDNFIITKQDNSANSRNKDDSFNKNETVEDNCYNSIKDLKFNESLTGTFNNIIDIAKENNDINKNNSDLIAEKLLGEEHNKSPEKKIKISNEPQSCLEELIKKYQEDHEELNLQQNQGKDETVKNHKKSDDSKNLNEQNESDNSKLIIDNANKSKQKLDSFCNFTVEDLIEPENNSNLNTNLCNENNIDYENIRVNTKKLEKFNNPERYKIVARKVIKNDFAWFLLADKLTDLDFFSYETLIWVPSKIIENKITLYEIDKSADIEEKNSINSMRQSKNKQCITCLKRSNSKKSRVYDINIDHINEKEIKNSNNNPINNRESNQNNNNKSFNTNNSSSRNFENYENFEDIDNDENLTYNNLQKEIKYNAMIREKNLEIEKLTNNEKDLNRKLNEKKRELIELKQLSDKLLRVNMEPINTNNTAKIVAFDKYEILFNQYRKEQEKRDVLTHKYEEIKKELDNAYKLLSDSKLETKKAKNSNNVLNLNQNPFEVEKNSFKYLIRSNNKDNIFNQSKTSKNVNCDFKLNDNLNTNTGKIVCNTFSGINNLNFTLNSSLNMESENRDKNATEAAFNNENIKDVVDDLEKNEKLLVDQLSEIKDELKQTRLERDNYKKKYNEAITLHTGEKKEICDMLNSALEKLINEIQITPKIKELLTVVLRIIDYTEDDIANIFREKENKKKNFFNFISRK